MLRRFRCVQIFPKQWLQIMGTVYRKSSNQSSPIIPHTLDCLDFPGSIAPQPRGSEHRPMRLRKARDEIFRTPLFSALASSSLWSNRAWKVSLGGVPRLRSLPGYGIYIYKTFISKSEEAGSTEGSHAHKHVGTDRELENSTHPVLERLGGYSRTVLFAVGMREP